VTTIPSASPIGWLPPVDFEYRRSLRYIEVAYAIPRWREIANEDIGRVSDITSEFLQDLLVSHLATYGNECHVRIHGLNAYTTKWHVDPYLFRPAKRFNLYMHFTLELYWSVDEVDDSAVTAECGNVHPPLKAALDAGVYRGDYYLQMVRAILSVTDVHWFDLQCGGGPNDWYDECDGPEDL
jgi:hypothetical protein